MILLGRALRAWDRFWFGEADLLGLALFRIGFGALWVVLLVISLPNWLRFYGPAGVVPLDLITTDPYFDGGRLSVFFHARDDVTTLALFAVALASAVAFTLGWRTRLATIALYVMVISMVNRAPLLVHGEDQVARPLLFLACFAPLGERLSIDAARRDARPVARSAWSARLLQLAVVAVYAFSAPAKPSDDVAWRDGSAIHYVMSSGNWARFPEVAPLFYQRAVSAAATYGTLAVEAAFVLLVWWRRTRLAAVTIIAALHVALAVLLQHVVFFNLAMLAALPLFVPDPVWERAWERGRARLRSGPLRGRRAALDANPAAPG